MGTKGTEDEFKCIIDGLAKNCKRYEIGQIKHMQFTEAMDSIFGEYNWSKQEFYKELNTRLGIHNNEERPAVKPAAKPKKAKAKKAG